MAADRRSLAAERTALGWQRSALSLVVITALIVIHAVHAGEPLAIAAAALPALGAAWVALEGRRLYARRAAGDAGMAERSVRRLAAITLAVTLVVAVVVVGGS
jgi:uncharacterized membrane protein YidH (DUF202 family)